MPVRVESVHRIDNDSLSDDWSTQELRSIDTALPDPPQDDSKRAIENRAAGTRTEGLRSVAPARVVNTTRGTRKRRGAL